MSVSFTAAQSVRAENTGDQHAVMPSLSWEIAQRPSSSYAGRDKRFVHTSTECPAENAAEFTWV
jgi:hypothetical protein